MSDGGNLLDEIVQHVFTLGVHVVEADRLVLAHTPMQLAARWQARIEAARGQPGIPADARPPEGGHEEGLYIWLRPRVRGRISFTWVDLDWQPSTIGDWLPVHRLADWDGTLAPP